jgi:hypothetical protein
LELLRKNFKDFLYYDGRRNVKILDPCMDIRSMTDNKVWGMDPIHPTEAVSMKIAASVIKISSNLTVNIAKRNRTDSMEAGPETRRGRRKSGSRADWDRYRSESSRGGISGGSRGGPGNRGQGGGGRFNY